MSNNFYAFTDVKALCHAGVKGMKWGVRNDKTSTSSGKKKKVGQSTSNYKVKIRKGKNYVKVKSKIKISDDLKQSAAVIGATAWVASAMIPGVSEVSNGIRAFANLTSVLANTKK